MLFKGINEEQFRASVKIRFSNIIEGFERYENGNLQGDVLADKKDIENRIITFMGELIDLNGEENSFVDFYFSRLSEEDKERLNVFLDHEDKEKFTSVVTKEIDGTIYFKLTKDNMPLLVRLSTREILFSTFYFTKIPCTIWGNYGLKFPCFFLSKDDLIVYKGISKKLSLDII